MPFASAETLNSYKTKTHTRGGREGGKERQGGGEEGAIPSCHQNITLIAPHCTHLIVSAVIVNPLGVHVDSVCCHGVEKVVVMGYDKNGGRPCLQ